MFDIYCKDCDRFLGTTDKSIEVTLKCSNSKCKKLNLYRIIFATDFDRIKRES